jgi:hypothetical protein
MRHHIFPESVRRWREDVQQGARLQVQEDIHRREMDLMERKIMKRVEAAERLVSLVLFEQDAARRQLRLLAEEVRGLREAILFEQKVSISTSSDSSFAVECSSSKPSSAMGWVDVDD